MMLLWDGIIRKNKSTSRFVPNGFPDKVISGQLSDIVFTDHQARSGNIPPWSNGRVAKELRASISMKPMAGIFSVGLEEQYRWKDFGLSDVFGVSFDKEVEGPMQNSYLRLKKDDTTGKFHPVLEGLEDAFRIINTVNQIKVIPRTSFPLPVTLIPNLFARVPYKTILSSKPPIPLKG